MAKTSTINAKHELRIYAPARAVWQAMCQFGDLSWANDGNDTSNMEHGSCQKF